MSARAHIETFLGYLLDRSLILGEDWDTLPADDRDRILECGSHASVCGRLVACGLMTEYLAARIQNGKQYGLVLGNYRVLERLGAGGMGVIFKAEHILMRQVVAVKVMTAGMHHDDLARLRFLAETRAVAQLRHPNIVAAVDAGVVGGDSDDHPVMHYFVMEYVPGRDLESIVELQGPLPVPEACGLIYQVCAALAEAHRHGLIHRDIKPSNVMVTPGGQAKLTDFGLARRQTSTRMTQPGMILGSVSYMAPEQAEDPSAVDARADIYALGSTLFWCLTGRDPYPIEGGWIQALSHRYLAPPPSVRDSRPEVPDGLAEVVNKMMAVNPDHRYATPQDVMRGLLPYLESAPAPAAPAVGGAPGPAAPAPRGRVLVVDDEEHLRKLCQVVLQAAGFATTTAASGLEALAKVQIEPFDLIVLDVVLPDLSGLEVLQRLRQLPLSAETHVLVMSGGLKPDELARLQAVGANDFLTKPFKAEQLTAKAAAASRPGDPDGVARAPSESAAARRTSVAHRAVQEATRTRDGLALAVAHLVGARGSETIGHLRRLRFYCRTLGQAMARAPEFAGQVTEAFLQTLEACVPLHDVGMAALPDHVVLKPGRLDAEERRVMQSHTILGAEAFEQTVEACDLSADYFQTTAEVIRSHHERWDGTGYPDGLAGTTIPLAARVAAVADVYDSLRSRRTYRPGLAHAAAVAVMSDEAEKKFDPHLFRVFLACADAFDRIFRDHRD